MNKQKTGKQEQMLTIIAFIMVGAIILFAVFSSNSMKTNRNNSAKDNSFSAFYDNDFNTEFNNSPFIELCSSSMVTYSATDNSVSKIITATVKPETASNKKVDWSIAWMDESVTQKISDYVSVTPDSDGSTNATVTCYQPFANDAVVTVTTRESGYTATCVVSYKGIPTDIIVDTQAGYDGTTLNLGIGENYVLSAEATNIFNQVGAEYQELHVTLEAIGSVLLANQDYNRDSGNVYWYDATNAITPLSDIQDKIITMTYDNGVITLTTKKSIESYYESSSLIDGGRTINYKKKFREYASDCYFVLKIRQLDSGVVKSIKIAFDETIVTGVTASLSQIYF